MIFALATKSRSKKTPEIQLRDIVRSDAARIAELAGEWDVARMTASVPYPYHQAAAEDWIASLENDEVVKVIEHDGQVIGVCGLVWLQNDQRAAEIGYWIGKPYWGQGFATAAVTELIALGFKAYGLVRLVGGHFTDNPASARVITKLGFRYSCSRPRMCIARSREVDAVEYVLDRPKSWWKRS